MAGTIGSLTVFAKVNTTSYSKGLKKAKGDTNSFASSLMGKLSVLKNPFVIATAAAAGFTAAVVKFAAAGDAIDKMSQRLNIGVGDLQSLQFAFEQSGGSASTLETSMRGLNRNITDLGRGLTTAQDNFSDLGLAWEDLEGLDQAERFRKVSQALLKIDDPAKRAGVAMKMFGRSGMEMLPLLENMESLEEQYDKMGIGMTEEQTKSAAMLTDAWNILTKSISFLSTEFVSIFAPAVTVVVDALGALIRWVGHGVKAIGKLVSGPMTAFLNMQKELFKWFGGTGATTLEAKGGDMEAAQKAFKQERMKKLKDSEAVVVRLKGDEMRIQQQISNQEEMIKNLEGQKNNLAALPTALGKGTSAQLSFINNLKRKNKQAEMVAEQKAAIAVAKKQLERQKEELKEAQKQTKEAEKQTKLLTESASQGQPGAVEIMQ